MIFPTGSYVPVGEHRSPASGSTAQHVSAAGELSDEVGSWSGQNLLVCGGGKSLVSDPVASVLESEGGGQETS